MRECAKINHDTLRNGLIMTVIPISAPANDHETYILSAGNKAACYRNSFIDAFLEAHSVGCKEVSLTSQPILRQHIPGFVYRWECDIEYNRNKHESWCQLRNGVKGIENIFRAANYPVVRI